MYPKRLILDDARGFGIEILGLDVNASAESYRIEPVDREYGIRLSLADVKGMSEAEIARILAGQPYTDIGDFWTRARVSRPVVERLVLAGAFDRLHDIAAGGLLAATYCSTWLNSTAGITAHQASWLSIWETAPSWCQGPGCQSSAGRIGCAPSSTSSAWMPRPMSRPSMSHCCAPSG